MTVGAGIRLTRARASPKVREFPTVGIWTARRGRAGTGFAEHQGDDPLMYSRRKRDRATNFLMLLVSVLLFGALSAGGAAVVTLARDNEQLDFETIGITTVVGIMIGALLWFLFTMAERRTSSSRKRRRRPRPPVDVDQPVA